MANSHFSEKKWKYVSIGLMAVLAIGFSFPQAFAHVTADMKHGLEHVIALLNGIDAKVMDVQAKVNSGTFGLQAIKTSVDTKATQASVDILDAKLDVIKCNSGIIRPNVDLSGCDLSFADLSGADLRLADLSDASLSFADLSGADLGGANLSDANLSFARLESASLDAAIITGADFDPCFGDPIGSPLGGTLPDCQ